MRLQIYATLALGLQLHTGRVPMASANFWSTKSKVVIYLGLAEAVAVASSFVLFLPIQGTSGQ